MALSVYQEEFLRELFALCQTYRSVANVEASSIGALSGTYRVAINVHMKPDSPESLADLKSDYITLR
ncbi:hypothetical protein HJG54_35305 (plasmid) [Leptolyngbya sp. NK1-12]|uniref:Uncharacterized protein n=1 Tax=Leptolyngbya sp. NK1-12 TaxID=2547451 RepID=A0AA96WMB4_9CYAN|nr:hypothetical protein [Leptolyngbya sp. NK1-12]WNZ28183.1 hypothetical protein HJG54_35305 [Leptolyngbya sp. NK1-12]